MPVRFSCPSCRRLLDAADAKIGQAVRCPGCQASITVPPASEAVDAPEALPLSRVVPKPPAAPLITPVESLPIGGGGSAAVVISRGAVVFQAVLLAAVAAAMFAAGYFIGGAKQEAAPEAPAPGPIEISGRVTVRGANGASRPDDGAAVLVMPAWRRPRGGVKPDGEALHPASPLPAVGDRLYELIEGFGAAYARTDREGGFRVRLARPGRYHVLLVSRTATREEGEFELADLATIGDYVLEPIGLLGEQAYYLETLELGDDSRVAHEFQAP